jgi:4'-phosphopantetheinyl transferase
VRPPVTGHTGGPGCRLAYAAARPIRVLRGPAPTADLATAAGLPDWQVRGHLAARAVLRGLAASLIGPAAATAPILADPRGQPFLSVRPDVGVSLSHTDGWVAAGVHLCGAIGVDVQAPVPVSGRLIKRCCTPSTQRLMSRWPAVLRNAEFAWIWSVQEACVKAVGLGVAGMPWAIPVEVGQDRGQWRGLPWSAWRGRWPVAVSCALGTGCG